MEKSIQAGVLSLGLTQGKDRVSELIGFASRENHKRGFLFVSKVLGKHVPVKPSAMRKIYNELANLCQLNGPAYVVGMSETATGLGAGVADSLSVIHPSHAVYYQHTTRHTLDYPLWFSINEAHSHAVSHLLYQPESSLIAGIKQAKTLILVDDEMTTGKTLLQLAQELKQRLPALERVIIVTLVNWADSSARARFDTLPLSIEYVHLISGHFEFNVDTSFSSQLPEDTDNSLCELESRSDLGRRGMLMPFRDLESLSPPLSEGPLVVVGTGEHLYLPFLLAEKLEQQGRDVLFQSTTRSPILMGDDILRKVKFTVANGKANYIYNLPSGRTPVVLCETPALAAVNGFYQGQYQELSP